MTIVRRLLVLAAFAFWQGGFTFYAAVVVPIGAEVLGSAAEQGRITRPVTGYMNLAGAVAIAIFSADVTAVAPRRRSRALILVAEIALLVALIVIRSHLEGMIEHDSAFPADRAAFRPWHRLYLWLSTAQWALAIAFLALTLSAWRQSDSNKAETVRHG